MITQTKTKTKVVVGVVAGSLAAAALFGLTYSFKKMNRFKKITTPPRVEETKPGYTPPGYDTPGYTPPGYTTPPDYKI